jgi:hypothetical protein
MIEEQHLELNRVFGPVHRLVGEGIEGIPGGHRVQQRPVDVEYAGRGRVSLGG